MSKSEYEEGEKEQGFSSGVLEGVVSESSNQYDSKRNDWGASEDKFREYGWTVEYANDSEEGYSQKA